MNKLELKIRNYVCFYTLTCLYSYKKYKKLPTVKIKDLDYGVKEATLSIEDKKYIAKSEIDFCAIDFACYKFLKDIEKNTNSQFKIDHTIKKYFIRNNAYQSPMIIDKLVELGFLNQPIYKVEENKEGIFTAKLTVPDGIKINLGRSCDCETSDLDKEDAINLNITKYLSALCIYLNQYYIHKIDSFDEWMKLEKYLIENKEGGKLLC